MIIGKSS